MSAQEIRFGQLYRYLASLGYNAQSAPTRVIYRKSGRRLPIVLPRVADSEVVRPSHLVAVERILEPDGLVGAGLIGFSISQMSTTSGKGKTKASRRSERIGNAKSDRS